MYAFIEGKIEYKEEGMVVISTSGIGYNIHIGNNSLSKIGMQGSICKLHTYLQVKEDALTLFGFYSKEEKRLFLQLITISGLGCKMALQIVGSIEPSVLAISIASGDVSAISKIKGIGKKTAERIILELKEKVGAEALNFGVQENFGFFNSDNQASDAVVALVSLGFGKAEAFNAVNRVKKSGQTTEELITLALRNIEK